MQREGAGTLRRLMEGAALVAALAVPLVFAPYTEHVFEPAKASLVRFLGILALGAGVLVYKRRQRLADPSRVIVVALAAVWLVEAVATVLSRVPWLALMGAPDRGQGLVTLTAMTILGLVAISAARRPGGA